MQSLTKNNKLLIVSIILSPLIFYCANVILLAVFNFGTYCGTFLRGVFNLVI